MSNTHEHLSQAPEKLSAVYDHMIAVMEGVRNKSMTAEDGEVVAKAGHVACKTVEVDLHTRVFAHKIDAARSLPPANMAQPVEHQQAAE